MTDNDNDSLDIDFACSEAFDSLDIFKEGDSLNIIKDLLPTEMQTFFEDIDRMDLSDESVTHTLTNECDIESSNKPGMVSLTPSDDRNVFIFPSDATPNTGFADVNENKEFNNMSSSDPLMGCNFNTALDLSNLQPDEVFINLRSMYNLSVEQPRGTLHLGEIQINEKQPVLPDPEEVILKAPVLRSKEPHLNADQYCKSNKLEKEQMNIRTNLKSVDLGVFCGKTTNQTEKDNYITRTIKQFNDAIQCKKYLLPPFLVG
ncbi:uncharacterized protein LOC118750089, partial [Rhagoletis pomonella]|uniref:uncharacterized protein LOC118750089 n=1 Tax=Rhagoletis pomonella TaxID=28610 RepID=UPI0017839666